MNGKPYFITFEGIEGCGKSTQAKLLAKYFRDHDKEVLLTREPGGPDISEQIRKILLDSSNVAMLPETELLLYMASRSQHTGEWILPALQSGKIVISDRYYDSTVAYQGAARKIEINIIDTIRRYATFGLVPDMTFLIDLDAIKGLERISDRETDRLEQESLNFHNRVRKGFLKIAEKEKKRYLVLDGEKSIAEIHGQIITEIEKRNEVG